MDVPPNSAGSERAKEFERLAETLFWPTVVEKVRDDFFDGLIKELLGKAVAPGNFFCSVRLVFLCGSPGGGVSWPADARKLCWPQGAL